MALIGVVGKGGNRGRRLVVACGLLVAVLSLQGCSSSGIEANLGIETVPAATPLMKAAGEGDLDRVHELVELGAPINSRAPQGTPLSRAAEEGHDEVVWYLLRQGAEPDLASSDGLTPLMVASQEGNDRIIRMLMKAGARVNAVSADGDTALAWAARSGNLSAVRILLGEGGSVNVTREGESLLMQVVGQNNLLMSQVLIDAGADVRYVSPEGRNALDVARQKGNRDLEMLLVQSGAR